MFFCRRPYLPNKNQDKWSNTDLLKLVTSNYGVTDAAARQPIWPGPGGTTPSLTPLTLALFSPHAGSVAWLMVYTATWPHRASCLGVDTTANTSFPLHFQSKSLNRWTSVSSDSLTSLLTDRFFAMHFIQAVHFKGNAMKHRRWCL